VGVLDLLASRPDYFEEQLLALLHHLGRQLGGAIADALLYAQVQEGRRRLGAVSRQLMQGQEAERRRLALELHDVIGQMITGTKLRLQATRPGRVQGSAQGHTIALAALDDLLDRVRRLALDLRPSTLDDLGLLPALLSYFQRYTERTQVKVEFSHRGVNRRFPPEIETAAYRTAQEALTNVARHAGVLQVGVALWGDRQTLGLRVEDQGAGFDPGAARADPESMGLTGMRERTLLVGGKITIESAGGRGTTVTAEFPLGAPLERRGRPRRR
jgi:signal transduction histidine kinase